MPTIQYSLTDVVSSLNSKIEQLQYDKQAVEKEIAAGTRVSENQATLDQINYSLSKAATAKTMMEDSCCSSQSCNFEYFT